MGLLKYDTHPSDYIGYWGPVTATIDWCEENYAISPYFAEFVNSTTNLSFFFLAIYHLYSAIKNKHGLLYCFVAIGMGFVGFGSWLFHMTLRYEFQLMDELPMIYVTAIPFGYIFSWRKSPFIASLIRWSTFLFTTLLTIVYVFIWRNPIFHQISYAILNFSIIFKTLKTINEVVYKKESRIFLYKFLLFSFSLFAIGFLIWNLDNVFCPQLISIRRETLGGKPHYGFVLEGHGWWHIFTSLGIYYFVIYNELLGTWMRGVQDDYKLVWHGPVCEVKLINSKEKSN